MGRLRYLQMVTVVGWCWGLELHGNASRDYSTHQRIFPVAGWDLLLAYVSLVSENETDDEKEEKEKERERERMHRRENKRQKKKTRC